MNILLHPKHVAFIEGQIQLGRYSSAEELVFVAVSLLQEKYDIIVDLRRELGQIDRPQQKLDGGRSVMSLEEAQKMFGTDKPA